MWMLALATAAEAKPKPAKKPEWGVGGHIGTWAIPNEYPSVLPKVDLDGDGSKVAMPGVERVRGDFLFGAEAWYWVDKPFRLGVLPGLDVGSNFTDPHLILAGDYVFVNDEQLDVFAGAGLGAGVQSFKGANGDERLTVPYYPLRADLGAMFAPTDFLAPQLRLMGQWNIPSSQRYTTTNGVALDKKDIGTGLYFNVGIELSVLYGRFH